jgi:hypothetical protein
LHKLFNCPTLSTVSFGLSFMSCHEERRRLDEKLWPTVLRLQRGTMQHQHLSKQGGIPAGSDRRVSALVEHRLSGCWSSLKIHASKPRSDLELCALNAVDAEIFSRLYWF